MIFKVDTRRMKEVSQGGIIQAERGEKQENARVICNHTYLISQLPSLFLLGLNLTVKILPVVSLKK